MKPSARILCALSMDGLVLSILHDPVQYDHLPYIPFPESWPVFTEMRVRTDPLEGLTEERAEAASRLLGETPSRNS